MSGVQSIEVISPHFRAGIFIDEGRCIAAAPALEWTLGKSIGELNAYFRRRGWRAIERVAPPPSATPEPDADEDEEAADDCDHPPSINAGDLNPRGS
jgi:hypothetical protein